VFVHLREPVWMDKCFFCMDKIGSLLGPSWLTTLLLILVFLNAGTLSVNEGF
jgi:hypothetical protein